jgi:hypothetical protein
MSRSCLSIIERPVDKIQICRNSVIGVHPYLSHDYDRLKFSGNEVRDIVKMWSNKQYLSDNDVIEFLNNNHPINVICAGNDEYWWTDTVDQLILMYIDSLDRQEVSISALLYPPEYVDNFIMKSGVDN